jgi:uncharacterized membrane protein YccC
MNFLLGISLTAPLAAIIDFAVLPKLSSFPGFCLAIGLVLVPGGALMAQAWRPVMFLAMTANFIPLLAPANQMTYDTQQFYNAAFAIVAGGCFGVISFRLLPPLSPAFRTRRLLNLTLRDLRRLATSAVPSTPSDWQNRVYSRLFVMPDAAEPLQRSQLVAALSVGNEIIPLRDIAHQLGVDSDLGAALDAVAHGNSTFAIARFAELDRALDSLPNLGPAATVALRARGSILAVTEVLTQHSAYFDARAPG